MTQAWERTIRRIAIGSDHAGFQLKEQLKKQLQSKGIDAIDVGTDSSNSVDFPDFAERVARLVSEGKIPEGILVCGTGIGMSMTANKFPNVRAAVVCNTFTAEASRSHNDANILCVGSRVVDERLAKEILDRWLNTSFEGGRHERRVNKIRELDRGIVPPAKEEVENG